MYQLFFESYLTKGVRAENVCESLSFLSAEINNVIITTHNTFYFTSYNRLHIHYKQHIERKTSSEDKMTWKKQDYKASYYTPILLNVRQFV